MVHSIVNQTLVGYGVEIFDLGLSSLQLKNLERGFSFYSKSSLDMSMGLSNISAEEVVNNLNESQLRLIIKILGEEKEASKIGVQILQKGGNAFDAMVATSFALTVVFPNAGNITGGGFIKLNGTSCSKP